MTKLKVGIIGATGMVGQRFISLLENHPWYEVTYLAASSRSAGKTYAEAIEGRWMMSGKIPENIKNKIVYDASDYKKAADNCDFVFCAVDMNKDEIIKMEEELAKCELPVISNNSANRWTDDVPMLMPEINHKHVEIIEVQKKRLNTKKGFIAVKPNCSIQSYVPAIYPLLEFEPYEVMVTTFQAISGAGKTFDSWPEMVDNVIPFIKGEEEKSEKEPLKIFGTIKDGKIINYEKMKFSAQCIRVPVTDGHLAAVSIKFKNKPSKEIIIEKWKNFVGEPQRLNLPSAPKPFITYYEESDRPQTKLDRDLHNGMGISFGRLREDTIFDYKFIGLSHNTVRGAAGGGILNAELLTALGYISKK